MRKLFQSLGFNPRAILFSELGKQDVKQAYRRSALGQFWLSIGMAVQVLTMGLVFGLIFRADLPSYLPFLTTSLIFWGLISNTLNESCLTFIGAEAMIRQLDLQHYQYVLRTVWRNLIASAHNFVVLILVLAFFGKVPDVSLVAFVPGLVLLVLNLTWVSWLLAMMSARFRDMAPIISSLLTVAFYVTPVMWYPKLIENSSLSHLLLGLNPLYHLLQIVRLPIMGQWPTWENWGLASLSAGIGWVVTLVAYKKYRNMIAYWV